MDKKECRKFFEEWLRAYADHLHLVRQGHTADLIRPAASKPPTAEKAIHSTVTPVQKSTNA